MLCEHVLQSLRNTQAFLLSTFQKRVWVRLSMCVLLTCLVVFIQGQCKRMRNTLSFFFFLILSNVYVQAAACANGEQNAWQVCLNEVTYPSSVAKEVYKRMKDAALEHGRRKKMNQIWTPVIECVHVVHFSPISYVVSKLQWYVRASNIKSKCCAFEFCKKHTDPPFTHTCHYSLKFRG